MQTSTGDQRTARLRSQLKRGLELHQAGKLDQAEQIYRKILRIQPDYFDALHMLGVAALQAGRTDFAIDTLSRAIRCNSNIPAAHGNLALAYLQQERLEDAVASYERQIALQADHVDAYANLAGVLGRLRRHAAALEMCDRAVAVRPNATVAHLARAVALKDLERYEDSLAACDRAIQLQPQSPVAWDKRGAALRELGHLQAALASHEKAFALQADFAVARLHAGMVSLLLGDYERGWSLYDWRTRPGGTVPARGPDNKRWSGEQELNGRTILLHAEQGLGDTLQFCRYAKQLEQRGARVLLSAPRKLVALLRTLSGSAIKVVADTESVAAYDWHCHLMSLPGALKTSSDTIPTAGPYLTADPQRVERWRNTLGASGFKIGIAWQGSRLPIDIGRSFPLSLLEGLSQVAGVRLISLQKNAGSEQVKSLPHAMKVEELGESFDSGPDAFLDTAAVMASLDLVITSDTSIAHLAGALGRPTWVALRRVPDWRWLLEREDSPWYPSLRLFRQPHHGDWQGVFERMREELRGLVGALSPN
jgi:tetratricopeptide (TPR) repeat protein